MKRIFFLAPLLLALHSCEQSGPDSLQRPAVKSPEQAQPENRVLVSVSSLLLYDRPLWKPDTVFSALANKTYWPVGPAVGVKATVYQADPRQTDSTPYETYDGSLITRTGHPHRHRWLAISHDLRGKFGFGDTVMVNGTGALDGPYIVRDLMHKRWRRKIDLLVCKHHAVETYPGVRLFKVTGRNFRFKPGA